MNGADDPNDPEHAAMLRDNERAWDAKTPVHVASAFYDVAGWLAGGTSLTVLERAWLGDVARTSLLHLQCHFGLDTLSLVRLGARATGLDFSGEAIRAAEALAIRASLPARFIRGDVQSARLNETFDVVFTSWGVLGWLPDLAPWARTVAAHLAPHGRFCLVEFHPFVWMSQVGPDLTPRYSYFNRGPITEQASGTYADRAAPVEAVEHGWNHSLADVFAAVAAAGLRVRRFEEFDHVEHDVFPGLVRREDGGLWFSTARGLVPLSYAIEAVHDV